MMNEIELKGDAVMPGSWYASVELNAPTVSIYQDRIKVYGNDKMWLITPDTARSMASALNHFADQADKYKGGE